MCNYTLKVFNMNDEGFEIDFSELHGLLDAFDSEETGKYFCELVKKYSEKYTPYDTGQLMNSAVVSSNSITYPLPYAQRLYEGRVKLHKDKHPSATSHWLEYGFVVNEKKIEQQVEEYAERTAKK